MSDSLSSLHLSLNQSKELIENIELMLKVRAEHIKVNGEGSTMQKIQTTVLNVNLTTKVLKSEVILSSVLEILKDYSL